MKLHLLLLSLLVIIPISSAIQTIVPLTIPDNHEVHAKIFGKTIERDVLTKRQTSPQFSQHDGIVESSKDFLKTYPLTGKNFQKAPLQPFNKSKKRACFPGHNGEERNRAGKPVFGNTVCKASNCLKVLTHQTILVITKLKPDNEIFGIRRLLPQQY